MIDGYFDNIINQSLWSYAVINFPKSIKYICPDHTFSWAPQGYFLPVYLFPEISNSTINQIKIQLLSFISLITGLEASKIKIIFYESWNATDTL